VRLPEFGIDVTAGMLDRSGPAAPRRRLVASWNLPDIPEKLRSRPAEARVKVDALLKLEGITKAFPGVQALAGVDLELQRGEVHALLGENGAGKSTLVRIVAGVYPCDQGSLWFEGRRRSFGSPAAALKAGIAVIHQETSLVAPLTVIQNIFLGIERRQACGILDERAIRRDYEQACARFGFRLPADRQARDLPFRRK
jgi:ribose transport system ATP-binding protein